MSGEVDRAGLRETWELKIQNCECISGQAEVTFTYEDVPDEQPNFRVDILATDGTRDWEADFSLTRRQAEALHAALGVALSRSK